MTQSASSRATDSSLKLMNRLSESRSPYVRGHMENPVAWQMWTPESLALAKQHNRLLFVSIGYSACHWCHVMERESFSHPDIASLLNNNFIPLKLDREERPDIDRIYMNYVQATTGSGGWPLNVFLTPDLEPLFGGTYFPGPDSTTPGAGRISFENILKKMHDVWTTQQDRCTQSAKEITEQLRAFAQEGTLAPRKGTGDVEKADEADSLELELLDEAYDHFALKYDNQFAGFSRAPKFPTPVNLRFLLRVGAHTKGADGKRAGSAEILDVLGDQECEKAKCMAVQTLEAMAKGGIKDQIGEGFARYSVTRDWSLPHFEKMLYDNAQLLPAYLDAYLLSPSPLLLSAVHDVATYLTIAPLHSVTGGFYSAEDADSLASPNDKEKREGAFYVWSLKEVQSVLNNERDADVLLRYYGIEENGNVAPEHDAHDELINQNVLAIRKEPEAIAKELGMSTEQVEQTIKDGRQKLRDHREKTRPRPSLDDKIVTAWNGLAIGGLARTAAVLPSLDTATDDDRSKAKGYLEAAERAVAFVKRELYDESEGKLWRVYREGRGDAPAFADDYAFLISGLIDLYEATFDDQYLEFADRLQQTQINLFHDHTHSGFFSTTASAPDLILRLKDGMDAAEPSTNGVTASNLYRLSSLLDDPEYHGLRYSAYAKGTLEAFSAEMMQHPYLFAGMLESVVAANLGVRGVVVCGEGEKVERRIGEARRRLGGMETLCRIGGRARSEWLRGRNEVLRGLDGEKPRMMVCEKGACREEGGL
ncbi:MAG: hypothetical protein M1820_010564 [Bogoriella megaspora]|nr:MAG: hypothetical protein M1820_010564 [Bogoriella megaspora]